MNWIICMFLIIVAVTKTMILYTTQPALETLGPHLEWNGYVIASGGDYSFLPSLLSFLIKRRLEKTIPQPSCNYMWPCDHVFIGDVEMQSE